jgi:hypothetical protein
VDTHGRLQIATSRRPKLSRSVRPTGSSRRTCTTRWSPNPGAQSPRAKRSQAKRLPLARDLAAVWCNRLGHAGRAFARRTLCPQACWADPAVCAGRLNGRRSRCITTLSAMAGFRARIYVRTRRISGVQDLNEAPCLREVGSAVRALMPPTAVRKALDGDHDQTHRRS